MSDERRKRAVEVMKQKLGISDWYPATRPEVSAMLDFADAEVAKERSRCANIAKECIKADLVELIVEKIERGEQ